MGLIAFPGKALISFAVGVAVLIRGGIRALTRPPRRVKPTIRDEIHKATRALRRTAGRVESTARDEAYRALKDVYLPVLKRHTPRGVHYGPKGGIILKPVKERLVGSYEVVGKRGGPTFATVTSSSPYIRFVLGGARPHPIPKRPTGVSFWWPKSAPRKPTKKYGVHFVRFPQVSHPGQKANPFHRAAMREALPAMRANIARGFKTKIVFEICEEGGVVLKAIPA